MNVSTKIKPDLADLTAEEVKHLKGSIARWQKMLNAAHFQDWAHFVPDLKKARALAIARTGANDTAGAKYSREFSTIAESWFPGMGTQNRTDLLWIYDDDAPERIQALEGLAAKLPNFYVKVASPGGARKKIEQVLQIGRYDPERVSKRQEAKEADLEAALAELRGDRADAESGRPAPLPIDPLDTAVLIARQIYEQLFGKLHATKAQEVLAELLKLIESGGKQAKPRRKKAAKAEGLLTVPASSAEFIK